jgi:hypothetical protein
VPGPKRVAQAVRMQQHPVCVGFNVLVGFTGYVLENLPDPLAGHACAILAGQKQRQSRALRVVARALAGQVVVVCDRYPTPSNRA